MHEPEQAAVDRNTQSGGAAPITDEPPLGTVALSEKHDINGFTCPRSERVQLFMRKDCWRFQQRNYARVWIWEDPDNSAKILGFYTLSSGLVQKADLNNRYDRKAEKGIPVPVALIGYMGRCLESEKGFGAALIIDAARRVSRMTDIGIWGLALDAENDGLVSYYAKLGFTSAKGNPRFMYGPLSAFLPNAVQS